MPAPTSSRPDPNQVRFGAAVKLARQALDLSPEEFAESVGITRRHLNNVESGRQSASNRLYLRIAKVLNLHEEVAAVLRRKAS